MFSITRPDDLPKELRGAGSYTYLNTEQNEYWLHAVCVAHQLLDQHANDHLGRVYYQDQFAEDFVRALKHPHIAPGAKLVEAFELDQHLTKEQQAQDPNWIGYRVALAALKESGRGYALAVKSKYGTMSHWEGRICQGGGSINECSTMPRGDIRPSYGAILSCMLSYEGFLARRQAETEKAIIANYARIVELGLCPGLKLQDIDITIDGKVRSFSGTIKEIFPNGLIHLAEGKVKGSTKVYELRRDARLVTTANIKRWSLPVLRKRESDSHTIAMF